MSLTSRSGKSQVKAMSDSAVPVTHSMDFNPNPQTVNWERLELMRLRRLNLGPERYSRHFQRFQRTDEQPTQVTTVDLNLNKQSTQYVITPTGEIRKSNSIAPFTTVGKATCGFFFARGTDNKKKKFGIPPTNLVKWRSFVQ